MNRTLRAKAAGALLAAAAAAATLSLATAGPASATTFPGPAGSGEILPDAAGQFGDPANIYARATSSGQVIEQLRRPHRVSPAVAAGAGPAAASRLTRCGP